MWGVKDGLRMSKEVQGCLRRSKDVYGWPGCVMITSVTHLHYNKCHTKYPGHLNHTAKQLIAGAHHKKWPKFYIAISWYVKIICDFLPIPVMDFFKKLL